MVRVVLSTTMASGATDRGACWRLESNSSRRRSGLRHLVFGGFLAALPAFEVATVGTRAQRSIQVNLEIGARHHHRADIATNHDYLPRLADAALLEGQRLTHAAVGRNGRNGPVNLRTAQAGRDVLAVRQHGHIAAVVDGGREHVQAARLRPVGPPRLRPEMRTPLERATQVIARYMTPVSKYR